MNILITGANGFIGSALTELLLKEGNSVFAIVTSKSELDRLQCDKLHVYELYFEEYSIIADLVSADIDIAYHFAWHGLSGEEAKNIDIQLSNVKATSVLIEQLSKLNLKKFVFASTMNTLEVRKSIIDPLNCIPRGVHIHVAAKINAEIVARTFCHMHNISYNEGIIAMAYGEGNRSAMIPNVFICSALNNIPLKLVSGNNEYDLIYINDIVTAFDAIGTKGVNKKSYYVGHNWTRTFREIFEEIKNILNCTQIIEFGSYPDDNSIDFSMINKNELFEDTGWSPSSDFRQSIINTANWLKSIDFKIKK